MRKFTIIACLSLMSTVASAQIPGGNVFFGYSYSGGDVNFHASGFAPAAHSASLNGWEGSLEGKFLPWIGIVADLSGHYGSHDVAVCSLQLPPCSQNNINVKSYTFLFGPRLSVPVGKFTPFAHFLVGAGHVNDHSSGFSDSDTSLATAVGGGIDYKFVKGVAWRLQGDEIHTRFFGTAQDHFRLSTGIVVRF